MNPRLALAILSLCFPAVCGAQEQSIVPLKSEPHHHLVFHNDFVNVYNVQVSPHDRVILHRHEVDAIGVMMSDAVITVQSPGKPASHQSVASGQLRLQPAGYVHSTYIDGDVAYRNVTVELLSPQQAPRNLCAAVIAGPPMNCPGPSAPLDDKTRSEEPEFETNQTRVTLVRILPRQSVILDHPGLPELIVVLDVVSVVKDGDVSGRSLEPGDFVWRDSNSSRQAFTNAGEKVARLVTFSFKKEKSAD
jgi:hypothetical protein